MHIGQKIHERVKELRIRPTELAKTLRTSKQNLYGIFKRESIDTDLLLKLGKALDFDFFSYYTGMSLEANAKQDRYKTKAENAAEEELEKLRYELGQMHEKYELLRELYETKTGKKVPGT